MDFLRTCVKHLFFGMLILAVEHGSSWAQQISITGGNLVLSITSGAAGSEPAVVTNTNDRVRYRRQSYISKITVRTNCPGQNFNLSVVATSPTAGTASSAISLVHGNPAMDFIVNIPTMPPTTFQTATLRYTASATFSQGNSSEFGNDVHTITYTLTAQ